MPIAIKICYDTLSFFMTRNPRKIFRISELTVFADEIFKGFYFEFLMKSNIED